MQSAIAKVVKKLVWNFQRIDLGVESFSVKEKAFFKVTFYIPTEDKRHWTQYDKLIFADKGNMTTSNDIE